MVDAPLSCMIAISDRPRHFSADGSTWLCYMELCAGLTKNVYSKPIQMIETA